ncbi:hypothetical protein Bbelb_237260 [Branchiostoma belcheri]|nr:hypothetical protein Bbelb_237260 [Branchiostoma belcheri]
MAAWYKLKDEDDVQLEGRTYTSPAQNVTLVSGLCRLRDEELLCDVTLVAGRVSYRVHRAVLAASSDYFRVMFTSGMKECSEDTITLEGVSPDGLRRVIDFMYTTTITLTENTIVATLDTASQLQIQPVLELCGEYIVEQMDEENCFDILRVANLYGLNTMSETTDFLDMSEESLTAALTNDRLDLKEIELFELVVKWLKHKYEARKKYAAKLMRKIRFPLMTESDLVRKVKYSEVMWDSPECKEMVKEAADYHAYPYHQNTMQSERTRLRYGRHVAIAVGGKIKREGPLEQCDMVLCYNRDTHSWEELTRLPARLKNHSITSVAVMDGFLYVCGGQNQYGNVGRHILRSAFRYDPRFDEWLRLANMQQERASFALGGLDGKLYAVAGMDENGNLRTAESMTASERTAYLLPNTRRQEHGRNIHEKTHNSLCAVLDGKIMITGGFNGDEIHNQLQCYDPKHDKWIQKSSMVIERFGHTSVALRDRLYVMGGCNCTPEGHIVDVLGLEGYNMDTDQWAVVAPMITGQSYAGAAVLGTSIFIVGGWTRNDKKVHKCVYAYDVERDEWRREGDLPERTMDLMACAITLPEERMTKNSK